MFVPIKKIANFFIKMSFGVCVVSYDTCSGQFANPEMRVCANTA